MTKPENGKQASMVINVPKSSNLQPLDILAMSKTFTEKNGQESFYRPRNRILVTKYNEPLRNPKLSQLSSYDYNLKKSSVRSNEMNPLVYYDQSQTKDKE